MSSASVIDRLTTRLFGSPILRNDIRGEVVEEIVAMALEPEWELCSGDWAACDLVHSTSNLRVQVKQSAARQSWHRGECPPPKPRFSIAEKTGRYEDGDRWIAEASRNADIFIFAWHPITNASADQRDPEQWEFYVVAEAVLPPQRSISLARVTRLAPPVKIGGLSAVVAGCVKQPQVRPWE
jgi:hypothetical protein